MLDSLSTAAPSVGTRFLSWFPALALMAAIFWLSAIPGDELPLPDFRFSDKLAHFLAYSVLGAAIALRKPLRSRLAVESGPGWQGVGFDFKGAVIGILYGMSDEVHQRFVPLRMFSVGDMVADALGVAAGIGAVAWVRRRNVASMRRRNRP